MLYVLMDLYWSYLCCHHQPSQLLQGGAGSACLAYIAVLVALSCGSGELTHDIVGQQTTALLELWPRLYQLVQSVESSEAGQEQDDVLYARIRRSMRPDCMMVFALDLQRTGTHLSPQQQ